MNELLKMILSLSLSGSLLIMVLLLWKPLVKNRLSKSWQYYIWLIVIARLLLPLAPETSLMGTLFQRLDSVATRTSENPSRSPGDSAYGLQNRAESRLEGRLEYQDAEDLADGGGYLEPDRSLAHGLSLMAAQNISAICLLVWLLVAASLLVRKITIYQSFAKYTKAGRLEVPDLALWERVGELAGQTGVKEAVGLYTNNLISSPLLVGFFRPCIMLPTTQLPDSDFQYTILHELTHCKRRDMFYKWLVQLTVCLHWFNPLVHIMSREINRACELSCDEAVIQTLDADGRLAYGDTLLNAVETGGSYGDSIASVTLSESKERLKERLDAIMNFKKKTRVTTTISLALAMTLCFGATAAGAYAAAPYAAGLNPADSHADALRAGQEEQAVSGSAVINLSSGGRGGITKSGSFASGDNQTLVLTVRSDIQGGTVDLFLFSPERKEQRFTFGGSDQTETVALSAGTWAFNCTGFFESGDITILGELKNEDGQLSVEKTTPDSAIISLSSRGQSSLTHSGDFTSGENQSLVLTVRSDIQGGTVDLFLFSPEGKEQHFTFGGSDQTETVTLSAGAWAYNCTGFFKSGEITILGEIKNTDTSGGE